MLHLGYTRSSEEFGPTGFGADPASHLAVIRRASREGYDHICAHQIGPDQGGFIPFSEADIIPWLRRLRVPRRTSLARRRAT